MPAVTFFSMLDAARKLHAAEMIEYCDIAAISQTNEKYHKWLRDHYMIQINPPKLPSEVEEKLSKQDHQNDSSVLKSESTEAKYAVMSLFASRNRGGG